MKIRNGFVSNSSSSSFICQVCGNETSGMDMSLSDAEMFQCVNNHTVCRDHLEGGSLPYLDDVETIEELKALIAEEKLPELTDEELVKVLDSKEDVSSGYEVPASWCPVCNFKHMTEEDAQMYLITVKPESEYLTEWKEKFGTYEKFNEFLKANQK